MTTQEIKSEIRRLKKFKKDLRAGTNERLTIGRQIKDLKDKLIENNKLDPDKDLIIKEILEFEKKYKLIPTFETLGIDLRKHTLKNLTIHLTKLKEKENKI